MSDAEMLEKLESSFETLSKERNAIVVPLHDIVKKSGFAPNQAKKCEGLLRNSCLYKLDSKKEGILVNKKNFKPMEPTMQNQQPTNTPTKIHDRIERIINALAQGLYEKGVAVRLALLTAIAGESIFFLGKPGYAKSMIACRLQLAFKSNGGGKAKYFEYLMNQFSTPEDIFGPISLKALNGEGENKEEEYKRIIKKMLPEVDIAFLDEIWKASAAIQNTLLTIINERKYSNGNDVITVPLKALFAASNELPAKDRGLEALFDRFILRLIVEPIQDEDNFFDMVDEPSSQEFELPNDVEPISIEEWESWKKKIGEVTISPEARSVISAIRKELAVRNNEMREKGEQDDELFEVSDRRWKKIVHILKTSAFLNDRTEIDLMDCQLIEYCIWNTEKQQKQARDIVESCITQNGLECDTAIEDINEQIKNFEAKVDSEWFEQVANPATDKIVTVDGQQCYECTREGTQETWFVGVNNTKFYSYDRYHDVYDANRRHQTYSAFSKNGDVISCNWSFITKKNPVTTHIEQKKYSAITHETLQKKFDRDFYAPIVDKIQSEIKTLKERINKDTIPFKENLFANQEYNECITQKLREAIHEIEDAKVMLDKQHNRYYDTSLSTAALAGDVILREGIICSFADMAKLSEEQRGDIIAVICIAGVKIYAMGIEQYQDTWDNLAEVASDYGKNNNLPKEFQSGWMVPDKNLLNDIWKNKDRINESLEALHQCALDEEEYWSSTAYNGSAAFFQHLGNGKVDHTTKDHEYSICVIREWQKE